MPIYEVTLTSQFVNQSCINRWNYVSGGIPAAVQGSFGLAFAFGLAPVTTAASVFRSIRALTAAAVTFTGFIVKNLYDPEDFYSTPFGSVVVGDVGGETLGPFNAYGFRTNQVTTAISRGTKRFVGVAEAAQNGGVVASATVTAQLQPLATIMGDALIYDDEGNTVTYSPAILGREEYVTPSGKTAYRKYDTEAEQLEHIAIGIAWEPYNTVRSQNSRQYGRGR